MKYKTIDHIVITTENLEACLHFYVDILGMRAEEKNGRYALFFGNQKFNIHTRKAEFLPAAGNPEYGSLDLCLAIEGSIEDAEKEIKEKGSAIEEDPVTRHGALGEMKSIYLRDPDGNLIELASYEG
ncbi:VOC family protein [Dialister hominis]|uniref:VOC family protein n=1 Tax=Dialister hominis TaxID=2582419 RepID=UPI003FD8DFCC